MGSFSATHWMVIAVIALLLFGYKRLPDAARSLGRSMRIFKSEVSELRTDDTPRQSEGANSAAKPAGTPVIEGESVRREEPVRTDHVRADAPRREE